MNPILLYIDGVHHGHHANPESAMAHLTRVLHPAKPQLDQLEVGRLVVFIDSANNGHRYLMQEVHEAKTQRDARHAEA